MNTNDRINALIPFIEKNFIEADTEYGYQLIVNIWQLININDLIKNKIGDGSNKKIQINNFEEFKEKELNSNINCFTEIGEANNSSQIHLKFSLMSKVDIGIEGNIDNITLDDLLDDALKVVNFCKNL